MPVKKIQKKCLPPYFRAVSGGRKTFEIRKDEDGLDVGDIIVLREWDGKKYTGRAIDVEVIYVLRNVPEFGLMNGYAVFGIRLLLLAPYLRIGREEDDG